MKSFEYEYGLGDETLETTRFTKTRDSDVAKKVRAAAEGELKFYNKMLNSTPIRPFEAWWAETHGDIRDNDTGFMDTLKSECEDAWNAAIKWKR